MKTNNVMIDFVNKIVLEDIIYFVESFKKVNRYTTGKTVKDWTMGFEDNIIEGPMGDESGIEKMSIAISPKDLELFLTKMANSKSISNKDIILVSPEILRFYVLAAKRNTLHITERLSYNGDNLVIDNKFAECCKEYLFNIDKECQGIDAATEMHNFVNFSVILGKDNNHYSVRVFSDNLASIATLPVPDIDKPVVSFDYDRAFKYFTDIFKDSEELSIFVNNYYKINYRKSNNGYIYSVHAAAVYNDGVEDYSYYFNNLIGYLAGCLIDNRCNLKIKNYISYHSSMNPLSDLFSYLLTKADIENTFLINTGAYIKENGGGYVNILHTFEKKAVNVVDHDAVGYLRLFNNSNTSHSNDSKKEVEYYHSKNITIKPYEVMADEVLVGEVADIFNFYDKIRKFLGAAKDDIFLTRSCNCGIPLYNKDGSAVRNHGTGDYYKTYHYRLPLENSVSIYNKNNKIFNVVFIKPSDILETINFLGKITIFSGLGLNYFGSTSNKLKRINADFSDLHIIMNHAFQDYKELTNDFVFYRDEVSIGEAAFDHFGTGNNIMDFSNVKSLSLGNHAFSYSSIKKVTGLKNLKHLFDDINKLNEDPKCYPSVVSCSLFEGSSIEEIDGLPKNITEIKHNSFKDTKHLKKGCIDFSKFNNYPKLQTIENKAFDNCSGLSETIRLSKNLRLIEPFAFSQTNIKTLIIDSELTIICENAFHDCQDLETVIFMGDVTVGYRAFSNCSNLKTVTFSGSNSVIDDFAFENSGIEALDLQGVCDVKNNAFVECKNLKTVNLGDKIKSIPRSCFRLCTSLTDVTGGSSVTKICDGAFQGCSSLNNVELLTTGIGELSLESFCFHYSNITNLKIRKNIVKVSINFCNAVQPPTTDFRFDSIEIYADQVNFETVDFFFDIAEKGTALSFTNPKCAVLIEDSCGNKIRTRQRDRIKTIHANKPSIYFPSIESSVKVGGFESYVYSAYRFPSNKFIDIYATDNKGNTYLINDNSVLVNKFAKEFPQLSSINLLDIVSEKRAIKVRLVGSMKSYGLFVHTNYISEPFRRNSPTTSNSQIDPDDVIVSNVLKEISTLDCGSIFYIDIHNYYLSETIDKSELSQFLKPFKDFVMEQLDSKYSEKNGGCANYPDMIGYMKDKNILYNVMC